MMRLKRLVIDASKFINFGKHSIRNSFKKQDQMQQLNYKSFFSTRLKVQMKQKDVYPNGGTPETSGVTKRG